jgi:hypothetical protein
MNRISDVTGKSLSLYRMTYQHYSDHIKLCMYLGKEPRGEFKDYYDFITGLWEDMEITLFEDHNKQGIIFHKGIDFYMEQDFKNERLRCQWDRVWSFLLNRKGMELPEIHDFITSMMEEHLICKSLTPVWTLKPKRLLGRRKS